MPPKTKINLKKLLGPGLYQKADNLRQYQNNMQRQMFADQIAVNEASIQAWKNRPDTPEKAKRLAQLQGAQDRLNGEKSKWDNNDMIAFIRSVIRDAVVEMNAGVVELEENAAHEQKKKGRKKQFATEVDSQETEELEEEA